MNKYVDFGNVKRTKNQVKKHYKMMNNDEFNYLKFLIKERSFDHCSHTKDRDYIQDEHIEHVFSGYQIIELNTNYRHKTGEINNRVLIRSNEYFILDDGKKYKLCLVLSLTNSCIVTAYYNYVGDVHKTVDMNRYEDFDIIDLLEVSGI